ncbi:prolipoprotein diacylglyceryl transferase [bacterium]|nr:prolipoprotein diacylglyceryl transferase [bacterium]
MYPELFHIGPFSLRSYGLALAIGFLLGILLGMKRSPRFGIDKGFILDVSVVAVISSIVGSRFFYVIYHLDEFRGRWLDTINPVQSSGSCGLAGFSMVGGIVLAIFAILIYSRYRKYPFLKVGDVIAPSFFLGAGITRIGCFLNGCCFGLPTECFMKMIFPTNSPAGSIFPNTPIHPTQLYASAAAFIILGLLILLEKKHRFYGYTFALAMMLYAIDRFVVDIFRYYETQVMVFKGTPIEISNNQAIMILLFISGFVLFIVKFSTKSNKHK